MAADSKTKAGHSTDGNLVPKLLMHLTCQTSSKSQPVSQCLSAAPAPHHLHHHNKMTSSQASSGAGRST